VILRDILVTLLVRIIVKNVINARKYDIYIVIIVVCLNENLFSDTVVAALI